VRIRPSSRASLITLLALLLLGPLSPCKAGPWSIDTEKLITQARSQIGVTVSYDPAYRSLTYPGGDVPMETGVCTDVVIRALRAFSIDLQKEVHEDMAAHFSKYPRRWKLTRPDKNIDHRRVPNLMVFFERRGFKLPISDNPSSYHPGDLVTCLVNGNLPHIMIVSDGKSSNGTPLVIHNIGRGAQEEDILFKYKITGHYRIVKG
jgi:uncharacterized protein YijF (DUF1287 family)